MTSISSPKNLEPHECDHRFRVGDLVVAHLVNLSSRVCGEEGRQGIESPLSLFYFLTTTRSMNISTIFGAPDLEHSILCHII